MKRTVTMFAAMLLLTAAAFGQKIKPEEIIAKSLEAIGTAEARGALKNMTHSGDMTFAQGPTDQAPAGGRGVMASEGNKFVLVMTFPIPIYPMDKMAFDGKSVRVGFSRPGVRSGLGEFLEGCPEILREGLLGGVLNTGWALIDPASRGAKLSSEGIKKIDGREVYVLSYNPKKGGNTKIRLYFDKESFRHVRTEYSRIMSAQMGATPEASARQLENTETLTEDFLDFKTENGLTLPKTYKFKMFVEKGKATREYFYSMTVVESFYNQELDANSFDIGT